jgi:hypothetical protein
MAWVHRRVFGAAEKMQMTKLFQEEISQFAYVARDY